MTPYPSAAEGSPPAPRGWRDDPRTGGKLRARKDVPWIYWLSVVLVSIVGTQITDFLPDKLEISLYVSTAVFSCCLALIFLVWYAVERTLSIHSIVTTRRELFY